ncbi:MAG: hypothetical protein HQL25_07525 [Candidatus Omnitrophica bacterium]|nr:hypothetical protein [Candidatus Omnitrophota bacterium]
MEPFSMLGVVLLSVAAGAMLSMVSKKPNAPDSQAPNNVAPEEQPQQQEMISEYIEEKTPGVIDAEKEKAIDELISGN